MGCKCQNNKCNEDCKNSGTACSNNADCKKSKSNNQIQRFKSIQKYKINYSHHYTTQSSGFKLDLSEWKHKEPKKMCENLTEKYG